MQMCRVLYEKGEFTDNLTIQKKEDWVTRHCTLEENEHDKVTNKKIGSEKSKRDYNFKVSIFF